MGLKVHTCAKYKDHDLYSTPSKTFFFTMGLPDFCSYKQV